MNIKNKLGLSTDRILTPQIKDYLNELIAAVVNRTNKGRDTAIANLRLEVFNLNKAVCELEEKIYILLPLAKDKLKDEIEILNKEVLNIRKESCYKNFFSGNNGFLYQLPELLSGIKEIVSSDSELNELSKFYAKNFYPVANSIIDLRNSLDNLEENKNLSQLSFGDLIIERDQLSNFIKETHDLNFPLFYSNLWNVIEGNLTILCDPNYEDKFEHEESQLIQNDLQTRIRNIEKELSDNGIDIIYTPTEDSESSFIPSANQEITPKPLIRRTKDKYIYAYGIYNK